MKKQKKFEQHIKVNSYKADHHEGNEIVIKADRVIEIFNLIFNEDKIFNIKTKTPSVKKK